MVQRINCQLSCETGFTIHAHVLWLILGRGPVGKIEDEASHQSDDDGCDKLSDKAERSYVVVVQERQ